MPRDGIEPSFLDFQSNTLTTYVIWADTEISEISLGSRKSLFSLLFLRIILSCPTYIFTLIISRNRRPKIWTLTKRVGAAHATITPAAYNMWLCSPVCFQSLTVYYISSYIIKLASDTLIAVRINRELIGKLRKEDSNPWHSAPHADALPNWAIPQMTVFSQPKLSKHVIKFPSRRN